MTYKERTKKILEAIAIFFPFSPDTSGKRVVEFLELLIAKTIQDSERAAFKRGKRRGR